MRIAQVTWLLASLASAWSSELSFQPEELASQDGKLEVTLTVSMIESLQGFPFSAAGKRIAPGYNGAPIGPTLRVKPGDELYLTLKNDLEPVSSLDKELYSYIYDPNSDGVNTTIIINRLSDIGNIYGPSIGGFWGDRYINIHFHGLHFDPKEEDIRDYVGGGESKEYKFKVPEDMQPGTYWYHDHVHGTSTYAYLSSLFGIVIVEGNEETDYTKAPGIAGATEVLMLLSEGLVNPDGSVPPFFPIVGTFNWTSVANGQLNTEYSFKKGETALFRVVSASVEPTLRLSLPNHKFIIVAHDGLPVPEPQVVDVVEVAPGGRTDFLVRFDEPGTFVMTRANWAGPVPQSEEACMAIFNFPGYPCVSYDIERDVATITITEDTGEVAAMDYQDLIETIELPGYSDRLNELAKISPSGEKRILLEQSEGFPIFQIPYEGPFVPPGVGFGINGRLWNPFYFDGTVTADTCETWEIVSHPPNAEHALHMHTVNFMVTHVDGVPVEKPFWRDTLTIHQNATVHVCFDRLEAGDPFFFHCHAAAHLDIGMASQYEVVEPKGSLPIPEEDEPIPEEDEEPKGFLPIPEDSEYPTSGHRSLAVFTVFSAVTLCAMVTLLFF